MVAVVGMVVASMPFFHLTSVSAFVVHGVSPSSACDCLSPVVGVTGRSPGSGHPGPGSLRTIESP